MSPPEIVLWSKIKEQKTVAILECPCQRPWNWTAQIIIGQIPGKFKSTVSTTEPPQHISQNSKPSKEYSQENKLWQISWWWRECTRQGVVVEPPGSSTVVNNKNSYWYHGSWGTGHEWKTSRIAFKASTVEQNCTHKYWRLSRRPTELGISPEKWLLERSSVLSFARLPISAGIDPVMLLFCRSLQQEKESKRERGTLNTTLVMTRLSMRRTLTQCQDWSSFLCLGRVGQKDSG